MSQLWTAQRNNGNIYIRDPKGDTRLRVINADATFARQLCNVLNSTPRYKFSVTDEWLDLLGVERVKDKQ